MLDAAYTAKYLGVARMLWNASEGDPSRIPSSYLRHLDHTWSDGDISLVGCLDRFDCSENIEDFELEEAIELLGKVNPDDWPDPESIESVDPAALLRDNDDNHDDDDESFDFAEITLEEKVEQVLTHIIESVFGQKVDKVRSMTGKFFGKDNNYGKSEDGSFTGRFEFDGKKFNFQIHPDPEGWSIQYRMMAESYDSLPPVPHEMGKKKEEEQHTRGRGW